MYTEPYQMRVMLSCATPYEKVKSLVGVDSGIRESIASGTLYGEVEPFAQAAGESISEMIDRYSQIDPSKIAFKIEDIIPFTCGTRHGYDVYITPAGPYAEVTRRIVNEADACTLQPRVLVTLLNNFSRPPLEKLSKIFTFDLTAAYNHAPSVNVRDIVDNTRKGTSK